MHKSSSFSRLASKGGLFIVWVALLVCPCVSSALVVNNCVIVGASSILSPRALLPVTCVNQGLPVSLICTYSLVAEFISTSDALTADAPVSKFSSSPAVVFLLSNESSQTIDEDIALLLRDGLWLQRILRQERPVLTLVRPVLASNSAAIAPLTSASTAPTTVAAAAVAATAAEKRVAWVDWALRLSPIVRALVTSSVHITVAAGLAVDAAPV